MIIMAGPVLIALSFFSVLILAMSFCEASYRKTCYPKLWSILGTIFIISTFWMAISLISITTEISGDYTIIKVDTASVIVLEDGSSYNVTKIFGRNFLDSEKIRVSRWNDNTCGVYWVQRTNYMQVLNKDSLVGPRLTVQIECN